MACKTLLFSNSCDVCSTCISCEVNSHVQYCVMYVQYDVMYYMSLFENLVNSILYLAMYTRKSRDVYPKILCNNFILHNMMQWCSLKRKDNFHWLEITKVSKS